MNSAAYLLLTASGVLRGGRMLHALSLVLMLGGVVLHAAIGGLAPHAALLVLLGLMQSYCAMRVEIDATLFERLAQMPELDLAQLDQALISVAGMPSHKADRTLNDRVRGAQRWMNGQAALCFLQGLLMLVCIGLSVFG